MCKQSMMDREELPAPAACTPDPVSHCAGRNPVSGVLPRHAWRRGGAGGEPAHRAARQRADPDEPRRRAYWRTSPVSSCARRRTPPRRPVSATIRVADIWAVCEQWTARGARFRTPPIDREAELRCYRRPGRLSDRGGSVDGAAGWCSRRPAGGQLVVAREATATASAVVLCRVRAGERLCDRRSGCSPAVAPLG